MADIVARVPITHEQGDGGRSHAPMILATMGRSQRRLILDTGSEVHLLTNTIARELGLEMIPGEEGTDHSGNQLASWSVGSVPLLVGEAQLTLHDVVAIEAPPAFAERGIDGILSPQFLHADAYAVIDMAAGALTLVAAADDDDIAGYLRWQSPNFDLLRLDRDQAFPTPVVMAAVDGFAAIPTLLNTGGKGTESAAEAVPGLGGSATAERLGGGVGGSDFSGVRVSGQTLVVGDRRLNIPSLAIRERMHDPQAMIGMDLLGGTVLAVAPDRARSVFWLLPAG